MFHGVIIGADVIALCERVLNSELAGDESFVDETLRKHVEIWNEAASATNRPDLFAHSDFHAYVEMLEAPPPSLYETPRSIN